MSTHQLFVVNQPQNGEQNDGQQQAVNYLR